MTLYGREDTLRAWRRRKAFATAVVLLIVGCALPASASTVPVAEGISATQFVQSDGVSNDFFGQSVAVNEKNVAVVGAPGKRNSALPHGNGAGAAYVFGTGGNDPASASISWTQLAKLLPADSSEHDAFGSSIALNNRNVAVVGCPYCERGSLPADSGSAYVFAASDANVSIWVEVTQVVASDTQGYAFFGGAVAINDDNVVVVGGTGQRTARGAAYVFVPADAANPTVPGATWENSATLQPAPGSYSYAGAAVAINRYGLIVVGATSSAQSGRAYVYRPANEAATSPTATWELVATLSASDELPTQSFGKGAAVSDQSVVVVGSPNAVVSGVKSGAAYVFATNGDPLDVTSTPSWIQVAKLGAASGGTSYDQMGTSVSVNSHNTVLVGAPQTGASTPYFGVAYGFATSDTGALWSSDSRWDQIIKYELITGVTGAKVTGVGLGMSVGISDSNVVIVGAPGAEDTLGAQGGGTLAIATVPGVGALCGPGVDALAAECSGSVGLSVPSVAPKGPYSLDVIAQFVHWFRNGQRHARALVLGPGTFVMPAVPLEAGFIDVSAAPGSELVSHLLWPAGLPASSSAVTSVVLKFRGLTISPRNSTSVEPARMVTDGGIFAATAAGGISKVEIIDCVLKGGVARRGGAILATGGGVLVVISRSTLLGNRAVVGGGVFASDGAALLIQESTLEHNVATLASGGGVSVEGGSSARIENSTIKNCSALANGGAVAVGLASTLTLSQSRLLENVAEGGSGGGVYAAPASGEVHLLANAIVANHASAMGGGVAAASANITVRAGQIFNNSAVDCGGGLWIGGVNSVISVQTATISGNSAAVGGGACCDNQGDLVLNRGSYIAGNVATSAGGGISSTDCHLIVGANGGVTISKNRVTHLPARSIADGGGGLAVHASDSDHPHNGRTDLLSVLLTGNSAPTGGALLLVADTVANGIAVDGLCDEHAQRCGERPSPLPFQSWVTFGAGVSIVRDNVADRGADVAWIHRLPTGMDALAIPSDRIATAPVRLAALDVPQYVYSGEAWPVTNIAIVDVAGRPSLAPAGSDIAAFVDQLGAAVSNGVSAHGQFNGVASYTSLSVRARVAAIATVEFALEPAHGVQGLSINVSINACKFGYGRSIDGTACKPCDKGFHSGDGVECVACPSNAVADIASNDCQVCTAGSAPNGVRDDCMECAANEFSANGTCIQCPPNEVQHVHEGNKCQPCGAGRVRPDGESSCVECPRGTQWESGTSQCLPCRPGTYQPLPGMLGCLQPSPGHVAIDLTAQVRCGIGTAPNVGTSKQRCVSCGAGTVSAGGQAACKPCQHGEAPNGGASACIRCLSSQRSNGTICTECPVNEVVNTTDPRVCVPCREGSVRAKGGLSCVPCGVGTELRVGTLTCQRCSPGRYGDVPGLTECKLPDTGFVAETTTAQVRCGIGEAPISGPNRTSCVPCSPGSVSAGGVAACTRCKAGEEPNGGGSECISCSTAEYSIGKSCHACPVNQIANRGNLSSCTPCDDGTVRLLGEQSCVPCGIGKARPVGGAACEDCPPGRYNDVAGQSACKPPDVGFVAATATTQVRCGVGAAPDAGKAKCVACEPGSVSSGGADSCTRCLDGEAPNGGSSACVSCAKSQYSNGTACYECPVNMEADTPLKPNDCRSCRDGFARELGAVFCEPCDKGTHRSNGGLACTMCQPGRFASVAGSVECQAPATGYIVDADRRAQIACALSQISNATHCMDCPVRFQRDAAQTSCIPCGSGQVSDMTSGVCMDCPPGRYSNGHEECQQCPPGRYQDRAGQIDCDRPAAGLVTSARGNFGAVFEEPCDAGTYANSTVDDCIGCAAGEISDEGAATCSRCATGKLAVASIRCDSCPAGTISNSLRSSCVPCPAGTVSSAGDAHCSLCGTGEVAIAALRCDKCATGRHSAASRTECPACAPGLVAEQEGQGTCRPCGSGEIAVEGVRCEQCAVGEFADHTHTSCITCPQTGVVCEGGIATVQDGFWLSESDVNTTAFTLTAQTTFYACPPEACVKSANGTTECAAGRTGPLCAVCVQDPPHYSLGTLCITCPPAGTNWTLLVVMVLVLGGATSVLIWRTLKLSVRQAEAAARGQTPSLANPVLKIVLNFLQVSALHNDFSVPWSGSVSGLWSAFASGSTVPVSASFVSCSLQMNYYGRFWIAATAPAVASLALLVIPGWQKLRGRPCTFASWRTSVLVVLYLLFPTVSREVVRMLDCSDPVDGNRYLVADFRVACDSTAHTFHAAVALIVLVGFCLGLPLYTGIILFQLHRHSKLDTAVAKERFLFLFDAYKPRACWWESLVMLRKLGLVVVASVLSGNAYGHQVYAGVCIQVIALGAQLTVQPYADSSLGRVETASLIASCSSLFVGLFLVLEGVSPQLTAVLNVLLISLNVGFLLFCVAIVVKDTLSRVRGARTNGCAADTEAELGVIAPRVNPMAVPMKDRVDAARRGSRAQLAR